MNFIEVMHTYFRGEKMEAWFFILPAGIILLILAATALKAEQGAYAWSIAIPFILFGLVLAGTGIGVGSRTNSQVAQIEQQYEQSPVELATSELERMEKVNKNFRTTFYAFGGLIVLGLLLHYFAGVNFGRGLGTALILVSAIGLLVDGFAERRAEPYTQMLQQIAKQ